jgi:predicted tellurium resistance membrane protein TerC
MKITFPMALLLLFIALKLTKYIDWSWWWVLCPAWLPLAIAFGAVALVAISRIGETEQERNNRKACEALKAYAERLTGKKL